MASVGGGESKGYVARETPPAPFAPFSKTAK